METLNGVHRFPRGPRTDTRGPSAPPDRRRKSRDEGAAALAGLGALRSGGGLVRCGSGGSGAGGRIDRTILPAAATSRG
ncbi:MAG: hypothetical protein CM1200mP2_36200 [Planctomycetaceae bacterium]|nr:MAG: hypothetical protein CM1200mP2_36200 [Planctomycetaceae bacterium]